MILQNVGKCTVKPVHMALNPQVNGFRITLGTLASCLSASVSGACQNCDISALGTNLLTGMDSSQEVYSGSSDSEKHLLDDDAADTDKKFQCKVMIQFLPFKSLVLTICRLCFLCIDSKAKGKASKFNCILFDWSRQQRQLW